MKGRLQQHDAGSMEKSPSKNYWQVSMHEHAIRAAKKFDVWLLCNCQRDKEMTETATSRRMVSKFKFAVMQPIHCFAIQFGLHGAGSDGNRFT